VCVSHAHLQRWHVSRETRTCNVSLSHTHIHTVFTHMYTPSLTHVCVRDWVHKQTHTHPHTKTYSFSLYRYLSLTHTPSLSLPLSLHHMHRHTYICAHTQRFTRTQKHTHQLLDVFGPQVSAKVHPLLRPHLPYINESCHTLMQKGIPC